MANPFDQFDTTQSGPVYGAPPKVEPYAAEDQQFQRDAQRRADEAQRRADAVDARAAVAADRQTLEFNATHNPDGSPKAKPNANDTKLQQKRASLESIVTQINRVDELYRGGLKDEAFGLISSIGDFMPTEANRQFDTAARGLAEQGLAAFRVPGVGAQSDTELRQFQQANMPSASNYDASIEEKLLQLRTRVDATRSEMGMPPAQWGGAKAAAGPVVGADGNVVLQDGGTTMQAATDYKRSDDPQLSGLKGEYLSRLDAGQSASQLMGWMKQAGVGLTPSLMKSVAEQVKFRKAHPDVPVDRYNVDQLDDVFTPTTGYQRTMGAAAQNPFGAAAMAAGNAVSGGYLPDVVGATGGNEEQARIALNDASNQHPYASLGGGLVGGVTAALGGEAALAKAGMGAGFGRSLLADTGYGAASGSGSSPENRIAGATWGAGAGLAGSALGQGIARGGGALLRGVSDPSVRAMRDAGVDMSVGQIVGQSGTVGKTVKGVEDALTSVPGVGDMISSRRMAGVQQFNAKAFDKALEPINANVGGATGEAAITKAHELVKGAFSAALKGKQAIPDEAFATAARGPIERLASIKRNGIGEEIVGSIEEATKDLFDPANGALSGENMQTFLESLRQIKQGYKSDPLFASRIKPALDGLSSAVEGMFARQSPEVMPQFNAAKAAYRRLSVMADAVNRAGNADGVFMPSQLGQASTANAKKFNGPIAAAGGNRSFFDFQRAGQNVLPSKLPDSGTGKRAAMLAGVGAFPGIGAAAGAAGAGDPTTNAGVGLGIIGVLGLIYSRGGQARLAKLLLERSPAAQARAAKLTNRAPVLGAGGTALLAGPDQ